MIMTYKINCYSGMVRELNNLINQIFWLVKEYYIWRSQYPKNNCIINYTENVNAIKTILSLNN